VAADAATPADVGARAAVADNGDVTDIGAEAEAAEEEPESEPEVLRADTGVGADTMGANAAGVDVAAVAASWAALEPATSKRGTSNHRCMASISHWRTAGGSSIVVRCFLVLSRHVKVLHAFTDLHAQHPCVSILVCR